MQSTSHQGPLPDRTKEHPFAAEKPSVGNDLAEINPHPKVASEQPWEPKFDRRQSWSQQDRKHELQERLLGVEKGREMGFSETSGQ